MDGACRSLAAFLLYPVSTQPGRLPGPRLINGLVGRIRAKIADARIIGATVTSALGSTNANHGSPEQDAKREALNDFIRTGGLFDGVADFDAATLDPQTGGMRAEFVPESTTGGPGDKLHPNRVGYLSMGSVINLNLLATTPVTGK